MGIYATTSTGLSQRETSCNAELASPASAKKENVQHNIVDHAVAVLPCAMQASPNGRLFIIHTPIPYTVPHHHHRHALSKCCYLSIFFFFPNVARPTNAGFIRARRATLTQARVHGQFCGCRSDLVQSGLRQSIFLTFLVCEEERSEYQVFRERMNY